MIHKPRNSILFVIIISGLMFILYFALSILDQSRITNLIIIPYGLGIVITLCDEIGYFNRKIISMTFILAWVLILYFDFTSTTDKVLLYGINGLLVILFIAVVLWMFRTWNKIEKAVKPYNKALEINPDDTTALNNKGVELTHLKRYNWARDYFDRVLELKPQDAAALHNKGVVLRKLRKTMKVTENANEYHDLALEVDPGFENAKLSGKMILET